MQVRFYWCVQLLDEFLAIDNDFINDLELVNCLGLILLHVLILFEELILAEVWLEEDLGILVGVLDDLLTQTADCHEDLAVLIGLIESLLGLFFIANHQGLFLLLCLLKFLSGFANPVCGTHHLVSHGLLVGVDLLQ